MAEVDHTAYSSPASILIRAEIYTAGLDFILIFEYVSVRASCTPGTDAAVYTCCYGIRDVL